MAQTTQFHTENCLTNRSGLSTDCSCDKEVYHYLRLATWSFGLFLFELVGGILTGSIALISDSLHVLLDGTENIVSAVVSKLSRGNADEKKLRESGGKISAFLLFIAAGVIIHEGYERIVTPHSVEWYMIIIATVGLAVNLWQMRLHHGVSKDYHNQTHFWQNWHLMSDTAASVAVVIGGGVMLVFNDLYWIDGALSLAIGLLIATFTGAKLLGFEIHSHNHEHAHGDQPCNHQH